MRTTILVALVAGLIVQAWYALRPTEFERRFVAVQVGDTLQDIRMHYATDPRGENSVSLSELFGGDCGVAVFFISTCPACRIHAPAWSGVDSVNLGHRKLPVAWVSVAADTGAYSFFREYALAGDLVFAERLGAWASIGVRRTPSVYLLARGVLLGTLAANPNTYPPLAQPTCHATARTNGTAMSHKRDTP